MTSGKVNRDRHHFFSLCQGITQIFHDLIQNGEINLGNKPISLKNIYKLSGHYHSSIRFYPAHQCFRSHYFSGRHNEYADFVPNILKRLKDYKVPSNLLEVEVTESVFMSDLNKLTNNLETLRDRGVEISVDDFGSGYSSLNLLSKVAVDTVKLDKQFLDDTMNSEREETALTIIKYLTKMLRHLGFKVLAEGVETSEQLEMLRLADCDIVQGYFYAKPMPIGEFRTFLQEFNERDN